MSHILCRACKRERENAVLLFLPLECMYVVALLQSMFPLLLSMFAQANRKQSKSGWANVNINANICRRKKCLMQVNLQVLR